ncbi:MAG: hypothetical protein AB8G96_13115, partial [Phycisphaerales bacterium]
MRLFLTTTSTALLVVATFVAMWSGLLVADAVGYGPPLGGRPIAKATWSASIYVVANTLGIIVFAGLMAGFEDVRPNRVWRLLLLFGMSGVALGLMFAAFEGSLPGGPARTQEVGQFLIFVFGLVAFPTVFLMASILVRRWRWDDVSIVSYCLRCNYPRTDIHALR